MHKSTVVCHGFNVGDAHCEKVLLMASFLFLASLLD